MIFAMMSLLQFWNHTDTGEGSPWWNNVHKGGWLSVCLRSTRRLLSNFAWGKAQCCILLVSCIMWKKGQTVQCWMNLLEKMLIWLHGKDYYFCSVLTCGCESWTFDKTSQNNYCKKYYCCSCDCAVIVI